MRRAKAALLVLAWLALGAVAAAQDANITAPVPELEQMLLAEPLVITQAEISRPLIETDTTLKADISFGGGAPIRVKLRRAMPGADTFNNVPRYDLAAYALQKLFLDPPEYVVPPTEVRMLRRADFAKYQPEVERTFRDADQVLCVIQYWLQDVKVIADVYLENHFAEDPAYARHIGQLNLLTYLIAHADSNVGNFLIGRAETGQRVFSIDNGVAFDSQASDRGELWKELRIDRLPADAVERLRTLTPQMLQERLGVLVQWQLKDGEYVRDAPGPNLGARRGVRQKGDVLQMGLTTTEINNVARRLKSLLKRVESGKIALTPAPGAAG